MKRIGFENNARFVSRNLIHPINSCYVRSERKLHCVNAGGHKWGGGNFGTRWKHNTKDGRHKLI